MNVEKARPRRVSQMEMEEQYDKCMDLSLRRFLFGSLVGLASALLMFRSPTKRWASIAFGAGVGCGSAYADSMRILGDRTMLNLSKQSPK